MSGLRLGCLKKNCSCNRSNLVSKVFKNTLWDIERGNFRMLNENSRTIGEFVERVAGVGIKDEAVVAKMDLPVFVGLLEDGTPKIVDLANNTSVVIAGESGTGKTVSLVTLLGGLLYENSTSDVKIELIDTLRSVTLHELNTFDNVTLTDAKWASHDQVDLKDVMDKLRSFKKLIQDRRNLLFDAEKESWRQLRRSLKESGDVEGLAANPFVVIAVDDVSKLLNIADTLELVEYDEILSIFEELSSYGRSLGIHLIVVGQRTIAKSMPKDTMVNSSLKIGFKLSEADMDRLINDKEVLNDLPRLVGEAYVTDFASDRPVKVRMSLVGEADITEPADLVTFIKSIRNS